MSIDYQSDVVESLFSSNVLNETAYQIPGDFDLPSGFGKIALSGGTINAAGTGYSVDDVLTLSGGTSTTTAQVKVTAVSTGAVTAYTIQRAGTYTVRPANPVDVTGGGGSGFKLAATWSGFSAQRLLTMIEIMRGYIEGMDNAHEAKLLREVMAKMLSTMRFGAPRIWDGADLGANAQAAALNYLASHKLSSEL